MESQIGNPPPYQLCYFCKSSGLQQCVTRSLYHKYNDTAYKLSTTIDDILISPKKQRSDIARKFDEIKYVIDDRQHIARLFGGKRAFGDFLELLEYYKFRKYVPLFSKARDNLYMTEQLHVYYYDKLKIYYNHIKRKLNITVEDSSQQSSNSSLITKTEPSSDRSHILNQFTGKPSKQQLRQYETESKALEDLMIILRKNQDRMKKIKSLRTQDCSNDTNQFKDSHQRRSNMIAFLASEAKMMASEGKLMTKKSKKVFFKYPEDIKSQKNLEQSSRIKVVRKLYGEPSKSNVFYEPIKLRTNSQSVYRQKSRSHLGDKPGLKNKPLLQRSQQKKSCESLQKSGVKSLPKVQMNFNIHPKRSMSSTSIAHPIHQTQLPQKKPPSIHKQQHINPNKQSNQRSQRKKSTPKTPYKARQIDNNDNLASITRRKIQELQLKSQRKKESRK